MKNKSIRDKLLENFALFSLIPVILFCSVMLVYISVNVQEKRKDVITSNLEHQAEQLDKILQQAYQIGQTVAADETVNQELTRSFENEYKRRESEVILNSQLLSISQYLDENIQVYIVGDNGGVYKNSPYSFAKNDYKQEFWYQETMNSKDARWFELHDTSYLVKTVSQGFLSLGIPVVEERTGKVLGCTIVEISVQDILHNQESKEEEGELYLFYPDTNIKIIDGQVELYDNDRISLVSEDGIMDSETVMKKRPDVWKTTKVLEYWKLDFLTSGFGAVSDYVISYQQLNANDWIIASILPKTEYYQFLITVVLVSLLVTAMLIFLVVYASYRVAGSITRPILSLKENVEKVQEGDFETAVICESEDEIGALGAQFNMMVIEIRNLMENIQIEHERQRHYELLLLQAQINPHFLYNTLDSLMWLIRLKNFTDAEKMLEALTRFFKTGLNKGRENVTIKHEFSNVESYLTIQLMRYKTKLSFSLSMEETIQDYVMPKLILQPLVENAIYHGIKGKESGGTIWVTGRETDGTVVLCVEDDGLGMEAERLRQIQRQISAGVVEESDSYGLTNVNERLKLYFGDQYAMCIESEKEKGTKVIIKIRKAGELCIKL